MANTRRLGLVSALLLLTAGLGRAQTPIAPPPHTPLDELVKEYVRLKLPLPPPDAPLVRIWFKKVNKDDPDAPRIFFDAIMGFRLPPSKPGKDSRYLIGFGWPWSEKDWFDPAFVDVVEPIPDSLGSVFLGHRESIPLAVQCKLRGWNNLADEVYGIARKRMADFADLNQNSPPDLIDDLRFHALNLIELKADEPGSDRAAILKRIKTFLAEVPMQLSPQRKRELAQLELTVAPRKSKPGTVEALIDDLTDYWEDEYDSLNRTGIGAYWKLAELGFDAVLTHCRPSL
jgi:hypothetical protein